MNRSTLENVATGILVTCAVLITGLVAKRELGFGPSESAVPKPTPVEDWVKYGSSAKWIGSSSAPVRIVEFADFQCPFCAENAQTIQRLQAKYPGRIAVVYRSFPLTKIHPEAHRAALAAECAADQGAFAAFHDLTYLKQDSIGIIKWAEIAERARVSDIKRFNKCLAGEQGLSRLRADSTAGKSLKISGTPTLLVNNLLLPSGAPTEDDLEELIKAKIGSH